MPFDCKSVPKSFAMASQSSMEKPTSLSSCTSEKGGRVTVEIERLWAMSGPEKQIAQKSEARNLYIWCTLRKHVKQRVDQRVLSLQKLLG